MGSAGIHGSIVVMCEGGCCFNTNTNTNTNSVLVKCCRSSSTVVCQLAWGLQALVAASAHGYLGNMRRFVVISGCHVQPMRGW